jgi:hypothetical protein
MAWLNRGETYTTANHMAVVLVPDIDTKGRMIYSHILARTKEFM